MIINLKSNIFLTGEINVGKTTLLNRVILDFNLEICGFRTIPIRSVDNDRVFVFKSLNPRVNIPEDAYIYKFSEDGKKIPNIKIFDNYGVKVIRDCLDRKSGVIIMDELGIFENKAEVFKEHVFQCLDAPIMVIGVIKNKESDFLREIRNRKDVDVIIITTQNREEKYHIMKDRLEEWIENIDKERC